MARKGKSNVWKIVTICFLLLLVMILGIVKQGYVKRKCSYASSDEVFYNPLMGFAVNADYPDAVEDNTLVYVDITWREWEPEEGFYDIETIKEQNHWERWKEEGKHVVLRFVCDFPEDEMHMDIPDWLYEQTQDGVHYDISYGKGYAPEYANAIFIEKHRRAVMALGKALEEEHMIAYVELGSLGHWGEWHMKYSQGTPRMPSEAIREEYVKAYEEAFPYAKLMARRPFPETAKRKFGLFNDMTGHMEETREWLSWIEQGGVYAQPFVSEALVAQENVWEYAPVGGEFTSSLGYDEMLEWKLRDTLKLLKQSHTTFIGPKCPVLEEVETYRTGVEEVLKTIGYRYGITDATLSYWKWQDKGTLELAVRNSGVAPIYFSWPMYLYVYDEAEQLTDKIQVPINLTEVQGGESVSVSLDNVPVDKNYVYGVGIERPDTHMPAISLDMKCRKEHNVYFILE